MSWRERMRLLFFDFNLLHYRLAALVSKRLGAHLPSPQVREHWRRCVAPRRR
jgi:hypothetical protein